MTEQITNTSLWQMDFAAKERRHAIAGVPASRSPKVAYIAPGMPARGLIGSDVSIMDARSVKQSLRGRGGARVIWWRVVSTILVTVNGGSLEVAMYQFHRAHHAATFWCLDVKRDFFGMLGKVVSVVSLIRSRTV